jgi:hypothetical protein
MAVDLLPGFDKLVASAEAFVALAFSDLLPIGRHSSFFMSWRFINDFL